jgi:hypothetical protein
VGGSFGGFMTIDEILDDAIMNGVEPENHAWAVNKAKKLIKDLMIELAEESPMQADFIQKVEKL